MPPSATFRATATTGYTPSAADTSSNTPGTAPASISSSSARLQTGGAHGIFLGNGRGGNTNYLYVASTASGTYEAAFAGGSWSFSPMGDSGDVRNVSVGVRPE